MFCCMSGSATDTAGQPPQSENFFFGKISHGGGRDFLGAVPETFAMVGWSTGMQMSRLTSRLLAGTQRHCRMADAKIARRTQRRYRMVDVGVVGARTRVNQRRPMPASGMRCFPSWHPCASSMMRATARDHAPRSQRRSRWSMVDGHAGTMMIKTTILAAVLVPQTEQCNPPNEYVQ